MPYFEDVLNESFLCLDRDDLDVCELVCPRWKASVDWMASASLALRHLVSAKFQRTVAGEVIVVVRRTVKDNDWPSDYRTLSLNNGSGLDPTKLEIIVGLLRNSFVEYDMRILCGDLKMEAFIVVLLRELQNCRVSKVELVQPSAFFFAKQMLEAAHLNLLTKEYELCFWYPNEFGTPAWKEVINRDFIQCADYLGLRMSMYNRNPSGSEWLDDLREMRDVKDLLLVVDADGCAEFMIDRLIEAYREDPIGFPRKLHLWSTDGSAESKWIDSMLLRNDAEKRTKSIYSTLQFADPSENVKMTVAISSRSVYLHRGCVDIITAFPEAADSIDDKDEDGWERAPDSFEESSDSEAESSDDDNH